MRAAEYDIGTDHTELIGYYMKRWAGLGRPTPVLEPMCGTGINLIPFLEHGVDIDGLDSSPHMLAQCRAKCVARGFTPNLYEQYLEEMALPRRYGFLFIPDRSFGHIYDQKQAHLCLGKLWDHLIPGGWLVLDIRSPSKGIFPEPGQANYDIYDRPDGSTVFETAVWGERDEGRVIRCWSKKERYVDGQLVETEIFDYNERFYDRAEFVEMLREAGFVDIKAVKALTDDAEPMEQDWMVLSCRKP